MDSIADRITRRMRELNIRQVDLITKKVASKGAISLWLSGGATPTGDRLVSLAKELQTTEKWLLSGSDIDSRFDENIKLTRLTTVAYAPVISWVQAGAWTNMEDLNLSGEEEQLPLVPNAGRDSFYLEVRGISNSPYYNEGEKICIDPSYQVDEIQTGEMVVVRCGNDATFKALVRSENSMFLKALNADWQPNIIPITEECVFIGKYVGSFKPPTRHTLN